VPRRTTALLSALLVAALLGATATVQAQFRRGGGGRGGFGFTARTARPKDFDGLFHFCRIIFRYSPEGDGNGWSVDWPRADINLSIRLSELTKLDVSKDATGEPNHLLIHLTDDELFDCPFVMMTEPGGAFLDEAEAARLRDYVLKGGFLWADDFWGEYAFRHWAGEIAKALPPERYPVIDLPLDHALFHTLYDIRRIPQIPAIDAWGGPGASTSERGRDSAVPHVRAVLDEEGGRIMVLMTHNTDFGDAFEREGDDHRYFLQFAPEGYAFGVNTIVYSMTH